ncbi:MAG: HAMP domain-containing sensor histidine kinase, partial [Phycisphaerales bacterium]
VARDAAAALPARAFAGGEPAWLTDLAGAGDHPVGARSVWAFPILDHGVCEGVVCLYSAEPAGPDDMLLAMMGAVGREIGAFVRRTRAEAELRAHRERLEELVRERTRALERSHERLRQAERLATVGTLAAGLGHDLSNLILPIRARLHSLAESRLSVAAAADVAAIGEAAGYLQRLASGLRLLAVDPERAAEREGHTDLAAWWRDVAGVFRAALPRGVRLEGSCPAGLPPVAVTASRLTQAVFNLVQNSAEALAGAGGQRGTVTIDASLARPEDDGEEAQRPAPRPPAVILRIADDGPGMAPTVAARCFEPYFSTKVRSVSTGMGLALVRGWVEAVGGSIHLRTNPGQGTEFTLRFPVAVGVPAAAPSARTPAPLRAAITVDDRRTVGFLGAMIEAASARAAAWEGDGVPDAELWVVGGAAARPERIAAFLAQDPARRVVALAESHGQPPPPDADAGAAPRVCYLGRRPTTSALRRSLMAALEKPEEGPPPPPHPAPAASMA